MGLAGVLASASESGTAAWQIHPASQRYAGQKPKSDNKNGRTSLKSLI